MATFVGGNTTTGSGAKNLTLPAGSAAGDVVIVAAMESSVGTYTLGSGLSNLYEDTVGTGRACLAGKVLTSTDVANGYVTITPSANSAIAWGVWTGVTAIETVGTPTKRTTTTNSITALAVSPLATGQTAVVVRFEKSSSKTAGPYVSPATNQRESYWSSGSSSPSVWIGDYTGPGGDRTFTDTVTSGNGCGIQVSLTAAAAPPADHTVSVWDGSSEVTGCTVSVWDGSSEVAVDLADLAVQA